MRILLFIVILLIPHGASAHQLATDGTIGAVLHVDPADAPVPGVASSFYLEFKDKADALQLAQCTCMGIVTRDDKEISSTVLGVTGTTSGSFTTTLPNPGAYTIQIIGTPTIPNSFQPFTLTYTIRAVGDAPSGSQWIWATAGGLVVIAFGAYLFVPKKQNSRQPHHSTDNEG